MFYGQPKFKLNFWVNDSTHFYHVNQVEPTWFKDTQLAYAGHLLVTSTL
jgi:hypothetical protein